MIRGLTRFATGAILLALAACAAPGGSARECVYDAPLRFSEATIRAMEPDDRRALLTHNRQAASICHAR